MTVILKVGGALSFVHDKDSKLNLLAVHLRKVADLVDFAWIIGYIKIHVL